MAFSILPHTVFLKPTISSTLDVFKSISSSLTYINILNLFLHLCLCVFICVRILHISPFPHGRNNAHTNTSKHSLGMCHLKCFSSYVVVIYSAFLVALHAAQTDLQVKWNDNCETALPRQGGIPGRNKATSNSNNEYALYQHSGLVREGDSLRNIWREGKQMHHK